MDARNRLSPPAGLRYFAFQGEPFEIGFNPEFLRDGLEGVESGDVVLKLISPLRPGLIQAAGDAGFLYLIMPIRLNV